MTKGLGEITENMGKTKRRNISLVSSLITPAFPPPEIQMGSENRLSRHDPRSRHLFNSRKISEFNDGTHVLHTKIIFRLSQPHVHQDGG